MGKNAHAQAPEETLLVILVGSHSDNRYVFRPHRGSHRHDPGQRLGPEAQQAGKRHAVEITRRARFGNMRVHMRIDPDETQRPLCAKAGKGARPGANSNRMIAAEDREPTAVLDRLTDAAGKPLANLGDRRQLFHAGARIGRRQGIAPARLYAVRFEPWHQPAPSLRRWSLSGASIVGAMPARRAEQIDGPKLGYGKQAQRLHG